MAPKIRRRLQTALVIAGIIALATTTLVYGWRAGWPPL